MEEAHPAASVVYPGGVRALEVLRATTLGVWLPQRPCAGGCRRSCWTYRNGKQTRVLPSRGFQRGNRRGMAVFPGEVQGGAAFAVLRLKVGPGRDQRVDGVHEAVPGRPVQWGEARVGLRVDIGAGCRQRLDDARVAVQGGQVQWGGAVVVLRVDLGPGRDQRLDGGDVASQGSIMQRGAALVVLGDARR